MVTIRGKKMDYERVEVDVWVTGTIADVQERLNEHRRYKNQETGEWEEKAVEECRFVFELDGYKFKHYSRWMTLSSHKKANLFKKYLRGMLEEQATPDADYNLDLLKGVKIKTMWEETIAPDGDVFQSILSIRAVGEIPDIRMPEEKSAEEKQSPKEEEEIPF